MMETSLSPSARPPERPKGLSMASYLSGLERYDEHRNPANHTIEPVLPAEAGPVHAVYERSIERGSKRVKFLNGAEREARCGRSVSVLLPLAFPLTDPDSCPICVSALVKDAHQAAAIASAITRR
jgi:hypothetical protein